LDLLKPPDDKWFLDAAFFLMSPPGGPFSSLLEIEALSPSELNQWIEKLSEQYQKQKEEIDKIRNKRR
jgi:hypothetical protein